MQYLNILILKCYSFCYLQFKLNQECCTVSASLSYMEVKKAGEREKMILYMVTTEASADPCSALKLVWPFAFIANRGRWAHPCDSELVSHRPHGASGNGCSPGQGSSVRHNLEQLHLQ